MVEICFKGQINDVIGEHVATVLDGSGRVQQSILFGNTSNCGRDIVASGGGIGGHRSQMSAY